MMEFAKAWESLQPGDTIAVSNGMPEPGGAPDGLEHRVWRSHNFSGWLVEKQDGPPRAFLVLMPEDAAGNQVGYVTCEGDGHQFLPLAPNVDQARALRWEAAKAYFEQRLAGGFVLPGIGLIQTRTNDREAIRDLADEARDRLADGDTGWTPRFKNQANEKIPVTITEILTVNRLMRAFGGVCYDAKEAIFDLLTAAGTVEDVEAVDIEAGYPAWPD